MSVKNLFKSVLVLLLLVSSSVTFAQQQMPQRTPEERAQRQMTWMQKNLSLTDDQNKKVYDILLHYAREADKAMATPAGPEKKEERKDIQQGKESELKAVLTGDQFQKYQAHVQEMKQKMQERRGGMPQGQ